MENCKSYNLHETRSLILKVSFQSLPSSSHWVTPNQQLPTSICNGPPYPQTISSSYLKMLISTRFKNSTLVLLFIIFQGKNAFQHSVSYKIPFNNTVFKYLSECNFSALKILKLNQLDLDEEQLPFLKNLKLPSLEVLEIN